MTKNKHDIGGGEKIHIRSTLCQLELQEREKVLMYERQCRQACLDKWSGDVGRLESCVLAT